jgi:hypothetical protein
MQSAHVAIAGKEVAVFFAGLTLLPSLFLELVIHLFNPSANDV